MGWDIPELLKQNGLSNKVLFTYNCKSCGAISCSKFSGPQKTCSKCLNASSSFPSVTNGVSTENLSNIYNIFDLYVQYSICEGFGMPQVEAGACGVPIATVNYSAMCDVIHKLDAYPIKIKTEFKELETKAIRVYPDNQDLANYILDFISIPQPLKNKKRQEISALTHKYYNWDDSCKKWENYFDKLNASGYRANWKDGEFLTPITNPNVSEDTSNFDQLLGILNNNMKNPSLIGSQKMLELLNCADYGFTQGGPTHFAAFGMNNVIDYVKTFIDNHNQAKQVKDNNTIFTEDFIAYANLKNKL